MDDNDCRGFIGIDPGFDAEYTDDEEAALVIDNPSDIRRFRVKVLIGALKLECLGMKRSGPSACSIVKKEFGFKGNKQKVLEQLEKYFLEEYQ